MNHFHFRNLEWVVTVLCIRPDKMGFAIKCFITEHLGRQYILLPSFDISKAYEESDRFKPLILILAPGSDPLTAIKSFTPSQPEDEPTSITYLSLGQGQGPAAEVSILEAAQSGGWIVLQNCHLATDWMPRLVILWENEILSQKAGTVSVHRAFRLWLTSYATDNFPSQLLQSGVKQSVESPRGLQSIMNSVYRTPPISNLKFYKPGEHSHCIMEFRRMVYALSYFHGVVLERRHFGPIGWNEYYDFNRADLSITLHQLKEIVMKDNNGLEFKGSDEYISSIDSMLKAIAYLTVECNYGGRVTDPFDKRLLRNILSRRFNYELVTKEGLSPKLLGLAEVLEYVKKMPDPSFSSTFGLGLNENASIFKDSIDTDLLLKGVLLTQPISNTAVLDENLSHELLPSEDNSRIIQIVEEYIESLPPLFDEAKISERFPIKYEDSLTTVLRLETKSFNTLLKCIKESFTQLKSALKGEIVMSIETEEAHESVENNEIPKPWRKYSYLTDKPLNLYLEDLLMRVAFFSKWVEEPNSRMPQNFFISGFFFPHALLTGVLQNFARRNELSVESIGFKYEFLPKPSEEIDPYADLDSSQDSTSLIIYGVYLEGGSWDSNKNVLVEARPKIHQELMPPVKLVPYVKETIETPLDDRVDGRGHGMYECPVYRTRGRRGDMDQSTGATTNLITCIDLPSKLPRGHWIDRGVAIIANTTSEMS